MCGDSTTRNIFAHMCGFHLNMTHKEIESFKDVLKAEKFDVQRCAAADIVFAPFYTAGSPHDCLSTLNNTQARHKFVAMPALHTLWSPGEWEKYGTICTWESEEQYWASLSGTISQLAAHDVLFGMASSLCDEQLGSTGAWTRVYKLQRELARSGRRPNDAQTTLRGSPYTSTQAVQDLVSNTQIALSRGAFGDMSPQAAAYVERMNRSGRIQPLPWLHCAAATDSDNAYDAYSYLDEGIQYFNKLALHALLKYPDHLIVDMHRVTKNNWSCQYARDGTHYGDPVMKVQASLLATAWKLQELLTK